MHLSYLKHALLIELSTPGFANSRIRAPRGVKNVFSVFFLESNTDRNTRIFLAVAVAYFAYFGPYFRIGGGRGKLTAI